MLSLGRGFSAPVIFDYPYSREELAFLACHDSDPFNRYEAMQRLAVDGLNTMIDMVEAGEEPEVNDAWSTTFRSVLNDDGLSPAFRAAALQLPTK